MLLFKGICLLAFIAGVLSQLANEAEIRSSKPLEMKEIRQVMRPGDLSGENHSIKVVISLHEPLPNITGWNLFLMSNDKDPVQYHSEGDGENPTSQTEIVFEGNLVEADSVAIVARNETSTVAGQLLAVTLSDLNSDVTWVGDYREGPSSSLRVKPGYTVGEAQVNTLTCKAEDYPCYYLEVEPKPSAIERCYKPIDQLKQCDDRIRSYNGPSSHPDVILHDNKTLEIEVDSTGEQQIFEVIAYDPLDSNNIYSEHPYRCIFKLGNGSVEEGKFKCKQNINLPEGTTVFNVLIVKLDGNGNVAESSLQVYGADPPLPPSGKNSGVIIGAIFGTLIGLAILVLLVVLFLRRRDNKALKTERGGSAVYSPTTTTEPAETA